MFIAFFKQNFSFQQKAVLPHPSLMDVEGSKHYQNATKTVSLCSTGCNRINAIKLFQNSFHSLMLKKLHAFEAQFCLEYLSYYTPNSNLDTYTG